MFQFWNSVNACIPFDNWKLHILSSGRDHMIFSWHLLMCNVVHLIMIISPKINIILERIIFICSFHQPSIIKQVIKGLFCFPGVFHYTEVVEDAEGNAFFDQVSNISTGIFVRARVLLTYYRCKNLSVFLLNLLWY